MHFNQFNTFHQKDHLKTAHQLFDLVGSSASECGKASK